MVCATCTAPLELGAAYCGACGDRVVRARESLTGLVLDGRYYIETKLAAGGFGAVYRAHDLSTRRVVALKVLHRSLASDAGLAARFRREAAALAALRDPHTVALDRLGETPDGTLYLALELLRGESLLAQFRRCGPLGWRRVAAILRGVCCSLAEAHARGIVHRDLKPANLHLEHRGGDPDFVVVLDFGVARWLGAGATAGDGFDLTRAGQAIGTVEYMSPEQIVGDDDCDGRSDLYALGVIGYEMLTGQRPFADVEHAGVTGMVTALMTRTVEPLASRFHAACLPPELDAILVRCLARDADERFATVGELAAALDAVLARYPAPPSRRSRPTIPGSGPFLLADADRRDTAIDLPWEPAPRATLATPATPATPI